MTNVGNPWTWADAFSALSALGTMSAVIAAAVIYGFDRKAARRQRQVEVRAQATEQWRQIVRLCLDDPRLTGTVLRGSRVQDPRLAVAYELIAILMADIYLIELRSESTVAGDTWIAGWKGLFSDLLLESEFSQFMNDQRPFYDQGFQDWYTPMMPSSCRP